MEKQYFEAFNWTFAFFCEKVTNNVIDSGNFSNQKIGGRVVHRFLK
jgi:hypothetical protein